MTLFGGSSSLILSDMFLPVPGFWEVNCSCGRSWDNEIGSAWREAGKETKGGWWEEPDL